MSNARQQVVGTSSYVFDNNGWYPRYCSTLADAPDTWQAPTHYSTTLLPYWNDWKILIDLGRNNDRELAKFRFGGTGDWATMGRDFNYSVISHSFLFYDPRVVAWGQGSRTRIDDVGIPAKSLLVDCDPQGRISGGPGLYGKHYASSASDYGYNYDDHGGIHNNKETFVFIDGHGGFYSTKPIGENRLVNPTYTFTYPPDVTAGEAEWWTMPYYPDAFEWWIYNPIDGYTWFAAASGYWLECALPRLPLKGCPTEKLDRSRYFVNINDLRDLNDLVITKRSAAIEGTNLGRRLATVRTGRMVCRFPRDHLPDFPKGSEFIH